MKAYVEMISLKSHTPRNDAATPRTAEDTMCVIGDVTLMESRLAMPIRKPKTPWCKSTHLMSAHNPHIATSLD